MTLPVELHFRLPLVLFHLAKLSQAKLLQARLPFPTSSLLFLVLRLQYLWSFLKNQIDNEEFLVEN